MLPEIAKLQTQNRNLTKQVKKQDTLLRERDEEITRLRKQIQEFETKEKNIAKNQSYIHSKVIKELDQKTQNERTYDKNRGKK